MDRRLCAKKLKHFYRPQRSWGKVMFLQASVILLTGGEYLTRYTHPLPPGTRYPPRTRYTPQTRYIPLGPGTPPGTRYTPPEPGTPPRTRYPPQTKYTPQDQVHPPGPGTLPWDQVHPPRTRYPPRTREIRPTRGWYASYWNAFLLVTSMSDMSEYKKG